MAYKPMGEMLVSSGYITEEQLQKALAAQKKMKKPLGEVVVELGYTTQRRVYEIIERQTGSQFIDLRTTTIPQEMAQFLPQTLAKKHSMVPVKMENDVLYIATADPLNFVALDEARAVTHLRITTLLAVPDAITRAIADLYGNERAEQALKELNESVDTETMDFQNIAAANVIGADTEDAAPTIRLVNSILEHAVNQNASDIHLEPRETMMAVRMRIDGVLRQVFTVPRNTQAAVIARIKVMGNMNIAEHKIPLDGRSNIRVGTKDIDLRISTLPTVYGEKVVIRLLSKSNSLLSSKGVGLTGKNLEKFNRLLENSNGVILIVGPTGSGKSTTMYTMIGRLNTEEVNLVTLEDPVEYNFDGVNQVQINEKTGMTFANGLRSILRQDPDIIAVGEIRDGETADIAMRAAITGHLVLSTLHTNDAPGAIDRLIDMGVEGFLIGSALKGVISQRLVRRICPNCKTDYYASKEEQAMLKMDYVPNRKFYRGKGCPICFGTGYRGRTAVFEILTVTKEIREAISDSRKHTEIQSLIAESDYVPLIEDCRSLVLDGTTTVEEAYHTVNSTDG